MTFALVLAAFFIIFVLAVFASFYFPRRSGAPYFPTPDDALREAFRRADLKPHEKFYDLGAGTGPAIRIASDEFGANAIGFEIAPFIYSIARIKLLLKKSRATLRFENLWNADIHDADVVFYFLAERVTAKVEEKLKRELKPGTRVIAYTFGLPTLKPETIIPVRGEWKMLIYKIPSSLQ